MKTMKKTMYEKQSSKIKNQQIQRYSKHNKKKKYHKTDSIIPKYKIQIQMIKELIQLLLTIDYKIE